VKALKHWLLLGFLIFQNLYTYAQWPAEKAYSNFNNLKFASILDSLSVKFHVNFSYNSDLIIASKQKKINMYDNLHETLQELIKGEKLQLKIIERQVIISKSDSFQIKDQQLLLTETYSFSGRITDSKTREPLSYAAISLNSTNQGTVANSKGEFSITFERPTSSDSVSFSYIGYKTKAFAIENISNTYTTIELEEAATQIGPVVIKLVSVPDIITEYLHNRKKNYSDKHAIQTAFYRETIRENKNYLSVCEAVVDISVVPYSSVFYRDQAHLFKGRKLVDQNRSKRLDFKLEGGIYNCLELDIVKNQMSFLEQEYLPMYSYKLIRKESYNNGTLLVIEFDQKPQYQDYALYKGLLYFDEQSKALVAAKFKLSDTGMKFANEMLVRKSPHKYKIKPVKTEYQVYYKYYNGHWYLDYIRAELSIKARNEKLLFNSVYNSVSEMAITETDTTEYRRFRRSETIKSTDIVLDIINEYDNDFWGKYNIIQPEQSLVESMNKLNAKRLLE
jgi:hypothetical protein